MKKISRIGFVGAGNVARHLSHALNQAGYEITWIWSRTESHALHLASDFNTVYTTEYNPMLPGADMIMICVNDDAVREIVEKIGSCSALLVHTSGSLPMDILYPASENTGVLYPVQTFASKRKISLREVPFCIEASDSMHLNMLKDVASSMSDQVHEMDTPNRLCLHIAAVFANNFSNYMYALAEQILDQRGLPASLLHPLIKETAEKATSVSSHVKQTGPASRGDADTIKMHLDWLTGHDELKKVYELLSDQILNKQSKHHH